MLYRCEKFCDECYPFHKCVIKNTFDPKHIWEGVSYVDDAGENKKILNIRCLRLDTILQAEVIE